MVACHECGRQISTDAKVCPQCGAKNRSRRQPKLLKWIIIFAASTAAVAVVLGIVATRPSLCESYVGRQMLVRAFDRSRFAQRERLHVVDVMSQKAIPHGERIGDAGVRESREVDLFGASKVCEVKFMTNDGKTRTYTLDFVESETAGYLTRIKPR
jgi:RNA polymerase subunit RPABC4/transcription elongation factor Spt4